MLDFIKKYWLEVLFGFVCTGFTAVVTKLRGHRREYECLRSAICALLRDRIIAVYNRYTEKEYFPIYERENLSHLTAEYYALGGNGIVKDLEARLLELPTQNQKKSQV